MITKMTHVSIYVLDKDEAIRFYTETLGFSVSQDMEMPNGYRWVTLRPPEQDNLDIILMDTADDENLSEEQLEQLKGLIKAGALGASVFVTQDCRKTYDEYKSRGVTFITEPKEQFYGVEALMPDNSGNWFSMTGPKE